MRLFSVVIPTLQRSELLSPLVDLYAEHPLVGEIIVINNASAPLAWNSPKVRVLQQEQNIYVNPAWNLGAAEARHDLLLISNDDIEIDPEIIDALAKRLRPSVGLIMPCTRTVNRRDTHRIRFTPTFRRRRGAGILIAMETKAYVPIPEDLLIYCGDDWLFGKLGQQGTNLNVHGASIRTPMSVTSDDVAFSPVREKDISTFHAKYAGADGESDRLGVQASFWNLVEKIHTHPEKLIPAPLRGR